MSSAALAVLVHQASDAADMPAAAQMGAWNVGLRYKSMPLLRSLVARRDLDRAVAYRAADHASAALRSDLCAREDADMTLVTAALGSSPTSAMLAALCRDDLPDESPVFAVLAARMAQKPTAGLARAIVNAPVPEGRLIAAATEFLLDSSDPETACTEYAAHCLTGDPAVVVRILDRLIELEAVVSWAGPLLTVTGLGAERQRAVVEILIAPMASVVSAAGKGDAAMWNAFVNALHTVADPARDWSAGARAAALALVADLPADRYDVSRLRDAFGIAADGTPAVCPASNRLFAAARKVRTLEGFDEFTGKHDTEDQYGRALGIIAVNPIAPFDVRVRACQGLVWAGDHDEFRDALAHLGGDIDALNAVYSSGVGTVASMDGWSSYPGDGRRHYLRYLAGQDPDTRRRDTLRVLSEVQADAALWQDASWSDVSELIVTAPSGAFDQRMQLTAMRAVAHWQSVVFAGSALHWETFAVLSPDFTGTLGELLAASVAV